jgi:hypothetical protein
VVHHALHLKASAARTNYSKSSTSKYWGVSLRSTGKWEANIHVHGRTRYLGKFSSEEDAATAYDRCVGLIGTQ